MQDILFEYNLNPTTWAYLSALLTIGIYLKFHRFWSVRNLDLIGLIAFSPALLLVFYGLTRSLPGDSPGKHLETLGYVWLFAVGALFVIRLLLDPIMVRRPLLEPNLNASGLTFTGIALMVFLTANVLASNPPERLEHVLARQDGSALHSPGCPFFYYLASFAGAPQVEPPKVESAKREAAKVKFPWNYPSPPAQAAVARSVVLAAQLLLLVGIVLVGYRHFDNVRTGVAAASLYLLLPYAGQMTGRIDHAVPGALLVWAIFMYRRPVVSGLLMGLVAGLIFYPLFLLPLWCSFYWRRGLLRYLSAVVFAILLMGFLVVLFAPSAESARAQLQQMIGGTILSREGAVGFWQFSEPTYRIPVLAVFVVLSASLGLWPAQKNLGTLVSCSAMLMLGVQFWHIHQGGLYMAWYLPLLVLTIFRPNLEDRVAFSAVIEGRTTWIARLFTRRQRPAVDPQKSSASSV